MKGGVYSNSLCNTNQNLGTFCFHIEVIYETYFKTGFKVTNAREKREKFKNHIIDVLLKTTDYIGFRGVKLQLSQKEEKMIAVSILLDYCSKNINHFNNTLNIGRNDSNDVTLTDYIKEIQAELNTHHL
jgi:hypothetical protein